MRSTAPCPTRRAPAFIASAGSAAQTVFAAHARRHGDADPRRVARVTVGNALSTKKLDDPEVFASLAVLSGDIANHVKSAGAIAHVPPAPRRTCATTCT